MKFLRKLTLAFLCMLTAAGSLLASLPVGMGACAAGNHGAAGQKPDSSPCHKSCCDQTTATPTCSCCAVPTGVPSPPEPANSCSACPCGTPADAVPPAGSSNCFAAADAVAVIAAASLDLPAQSALVGRSLLMHHPPPVADLVTSLSRLLC